MTPKRPRRNRAQQGFINDKKAKEDRDRKQRRTKAQIARDLAMEEMAEVLDKK